MQDVAVKQVYQYIKRIANNMAWANQTKNESISTEQFLLIGEGFKLSIGDGFNLLIQEAQNGWVNQIKN